MQFQQMELMSQMTNVINAANAECAKGTKCYDQQQVTDTKNKYDAAVIVANNAPKMVETAHYDYLVASKGETAAKEELKRQHMATGMQERATATAQFEGFYRGVTDILTSDDAKHELNDIKMQFYALMEKYPQTYANFKMTPNLPSARDAHDRMDAELTKLYGRMFLFRGTMEKRQNDNEAAIAKLAQESAGLNAEFEERTASLNSKNALMSQMPFTVGSGRDVSVIESFANRQINVDVQGIATQYRTVGDATDIKFTTDQPLWYSQWCNSNTTDTCEATYRLVFSLGRMVTASDMEINTSLTPKERDEGNDGKLRLTDPDIRFKVLNLSGHRIKAILQGKRQNTDKWYDIDVPPQYVAPGNHIILFQGVNTDDKRTGNFKLTTTSVTSYIQDHSLVVESASIAKRAYIYAVFRIIYLLIGICVVSYFIYQLVRSPDSVVLNDARAFTNKTYDAVAARAREIPNPMGVRGNANPMGMRGNNPMGMRGNAMGARRMY
jgi:hypothetical protein